MQVVDEQHAGPLGGDGQHELRYRFEQARPPAHVGRRGGRGEHGEALPQLGDEARRLGEPLGRGPAEPGGFERAAQRLHDRPIRDSGRRIIAAASQHGPALGAYPAQELLGEPGLADARFPFEQRDATAPGCHRAPGRRQGAPLSISPDKARLE